MEGVAEGVMEGVTEGVMEGVAEGVMEGVTEGGSQILKQVCNPVSLFSISRTYNRRVTFLTPVVMYSFLSGE
jgi:hypothetical protein